MKKFVFDIVLDEENICNLQHDRRQLIDDAHCGKRIVFYGRRNTGKTSLVKSVVIPAYQAKHKNGLIVFVDLMGVKTMSQINARFCVAFEQAVSQVKPAKSFMVNLGKAIKGIRPNLTLDPITGSPTFSLGLSENKSVLDIKGLFKQIGVYHQKNSALIVMDEFQDVSFVDEAQGLLRDALQNLPADLPVIVLGSKKHLLSEIFSDPRAPLAGWGTYHEISSISAKDYHQYILERFRPHALSLALEETEFILELLQNVPEAVNILCDQILRKYAGSTAAITSQKILEALRRVVEERQGFFEERLSRFTEKERSFLVTLSKREPEVFPHGKDFLRAVNLSPGGNRPILQRLESEAIIYKTPKGYVLSDPILANYLRIYF
jgi:hypothetical protein